MLNKNANSTKIPLEYTTVISHSKPNIQASKHETHMKNTSIAVVMREYSF
jgi:hypothetical protein